MRTMRRRVSSVRGLKVRHRKLANGETRVEVVSFGPVVTRPKDSGKAKVNRQRKV